MPLGAVVIGRTVIVPDAERPVAAIIDEDLSDRWVTWPEAPLPDRAIGEVQLLPTSKGAWVIYQAEDTEGPDYLVQRTAVFVTPNGVTAACDLGQGRPVGIDADGLWVGDPRDASAWMESPDSAETAKEAVGAEELTAEGMEWVPSEPFWPGEAGNEGTAAISAPMLEHSDGASDAGQQTEYPTHTGTAADDDTSVGEPGPPLPTPETELVRISTDGKRTVIQVDHLVHRVDVSQDTLTLQYFPTGPRQVPLGNDLGWDVVYEPEQVVIDIADGLPERIETEQLPSKPAPQDYEEESEQDCGRLQAAAAQWQDRFELDGVQGAAWPLRNLREEARTGATSKLREQFETLARPNIVWTYDHPSLRLGRSDYRNLSVTEEKAWPATEIVVSFEHIAVPNLRLRRRYRVFNDAGRPREWAYATVHLDEDLHIGNIPSRSAATNGVLDI